MKNVDTPGYIADHWCERGHVVHVIVADGDGAHRSSTMVGARLLIVD